MSFATIHRDDPRPLLMPLAGLVIERETDAATMAQLQNKPLAAMQQRFEAGHRPYVARVGGQLAAWDWVATRVAHIGELNATVSLPQGERYLWNFVTLPEFRGRGIYPRLLDEIIKIESRDAERFWIAYAPENHASGAGITKAGFQRAAERSFDREGRAAVRALSAHGTTLASRVLGIRETTESLTPCWRCVRAGRPAMYCADGECACDYQRVDSGCDKVTHAACG